MTLMSLFLVCLALGWGLARQFSHRPANTSHNYQWSQDKLSQQWLPEFNRQDWPNFLAFLGMVLVMVSSTPLLSLAGDSAFWMYCVFLAYATTLWGLSVWVKRWLPWVGTTFLYLGIAFLPINWMALANLQLGQFSEVTLMALACLVLSWITWSSFRILTWHTSALFVPVFSFLGAYTALSPGFYDSLYSSYHPWFTLNHYPIDLLYDLLFIIPFVGAALGCFWEFYYHFKRQNAYPPTILLLLVMYLMILVVNRLPLESWGLYLAAIGLLQSSLAMVAKYHKAPMSQSFEWQALILWVVGWGFGMYNLFDFGLICALGFGIFWGLALSYAQHWKRWLYQSVSVLALVSGSVVLLYEQRLQADIQSLIFASLSSACIVLAHWRLPSYWMGELWKKSAYYAALLLSFWTWVLFAQFEDWSVWTLFALALTSVTYFCFAIYHQRNVLSYVGSATLTLGVFGSVMLWDPLTPFEGFRWLGLVYSATLIGGAYLLQRHWPESKGHTPPKLKITHWKELLTGDIFHPFQFQSRYQSKVPYLICEPLYNTALILTSVAFLFDAGQGSLAFCAGLIYLSVFKVYPSRVWIYFVILAMTDGALELMGTYMPDRYQSWALVSLSMGWFFTGVVVEHFLDAQARKNPFSVLEKERKYAQPFFQAGILLNVWLLRYFFGDLQNLMSEQGWQNMKREAAPLLLTGMFYVLKMRVYISKLWLYPGLIVGTIGLYFTGMGLLEWGFGQDASAFSLLLFVLLGGLWLHIGRVFKQSATVQDYLQEIIQYRWPKLDPHSRLYAAHIAQFESPFYTIGLSLIVIGQCFALSLFPGVNAWFYAHLEFSIAGSDWILQYQVQALLWAIAATLWLREYSCTKHSGYFYLSLASLQGLYIWLWVPLLNSPFEWALALMGLAFISLLSQRGLDKFKTPLDLRYLYGFGHVMASLALYLHPDLGMWPLQMLYWGLYFVLSGSALGFYALQLCFLASLGVYAHHWHLPLSWAFGLAGGVSMLLAEQLGVFHKELRWCSYAQLGASIPLIYLAEPHVLESVYLMSLGWLFCTGILASNKDGKTIYVALAGLLVLPGAVYAHAHPTQLGVLWLAGALLLGFAPPLHKNALPYGLLTQYLAPVLLGWCSYFLLLEGYLGQLAYGLPLALAWWMVSPGRSELKDWGFRCGYLLLGLCLTLQWLQGELGLLLLLLWALLGMAWAYQSQYPRDAQFSVLGLGVASLIALETALPIWGSLGLLVSLGIGKTHPKLLVLRWPTEVFYKPLRIWEWAWPLGYFACFWIPLMEHRMDLIHGEPGALWMGFNMLAALGILSLVVYKRETRKWWWGVSALFQLVWVPMWGMTRYDGFNDVWYFHMTLGTICLSSLCLAAKTIQTKPHRDMIYVSALCGLFFMPCLSASDTHFHAFFTGVYALEWTALIGGILCAAFVFRIQIFLVTALGMLMTTLGIYLSLLSQSPLMQSAWLAWMGLLTLGLLCIGVAIGFQHFAQHWRHKLERMVYAFQQWH